MREGQEPPADEVCWTEVLLDRYLAAPYDVVPKTNMVFHGIDEEGKRTDLIAYLRSLNAPP